MHVFANAFIVRTCPYREAKEQLGSALESRLTKQEVQEKGVLQKGKRTFKYVSAYRQAHPSSIHLHLRTALSIAVNRNVLATAMPKN